MKQVFYLLATMLCSTSVLAQQIDSSFAVQGLLPYQGTFSNGNGNQGSGNATVVQPDGKIVTVMSLDFNNTEDLFLYVYRYLPTGEPDPTFGVNGATKAFCGQNSNGLDVKLQSDGKIVLVGESRYCINGVCGANQFVMMRFHPNGDLDSTFGVNGHLLTSHVYGATGLFALPKKVHILPDGKFLVGGSAPNGYASVLRLNSNGFPDPTFGEDGVYYSPASFHAGFVDMVVNDNGETFALCTSININPNTLNYDSLDFKDNLIFKVTNTGVLDQSFGNFGSFRFSTDVTDNPASIILTSTNKLYVAGTSLPIHSHYTTLPVQGYGQVNRGYIASISISGAWDNTIPNGFQVFSFPDDSATFFTKIIERSPTEYIVCGYTISPLDWKFPTKALIVSVDEQAQLKQQFNNSGYLIFDHGTMGTGPGEHERLATLMDIDFTANDKLLLTGYRNPLIGVVKRSIYMFQLTDLPGTNPLELDENTSDNQVFIYPNPVQGQAFVVETQEASELVIYSLSGQQIYATTLKKGYNSLVLPVNYSGLAVLRLQSVSGIVETRKLVFE